MGPTSLSMPYSSFLVLCILGVVCGGVGTCREASGFARTNCQTGLVQKGVSKEAVASAPDSIIVSKCRPSRHGVHSCPHILQP